MQRAAGSCEVSLQCKIIRFTVPRAVNVMMLRGMLVNELRCAAGSKLSDTPQHAVHKFVNQGSHLCIGHGILYMKGWSSLGIAKVG